MQCMSWEVQWNLTGQQPNVHTTHLCSVSGEMLILLAEIKIVKIKAFVKVHILREFWIFKTIFLEISTILQ